MLNPHAGGGLAGRQWPRLQAELEARGWTLTLISEGTADAALRRLGALPPETAVLAVGGDGTVGALLPALVGTPRTLGIIPLGTGNDFAGLLGLTPGAFAQALDRMDFAPRAVDALRVRCGEPSGAQHETLLLNGLGMGFDADVTANMGRVPARVQGFTRYAWSALATLRELSLTTVTVHADGAHLYTGPSAIVAVMNGTRYGGGFLISPESDLRDGRANVVVGGPMNRLSLLGLMALVLRGRHLSHPLVTHAAASRVEIAWDRPVRIHLDGDLGTPVTRVEVTVLPGAVRLMNA